MSAPLSPAARQALRSLKDCKVIRTRFNHAGMVELHRAGRVSFTLKDGAIDWRLA